MTDINAFDYQLPHHLIAQKPAPEREDSRLLVLTRADRSVRHASFKDLTQFLRPDDLLVLNDSKVIPARVFAQKKETGAGLELLFLKKLADSSWSALVRPRKRVGTGTKIVLSDGCTAASVGVERAPGEFEIVFDALPEGGLLPVLEKIGFAPLPPYIKRDYAHYPHDQNVHDARRYQTVFCRTAGSAAAPTAGLHFSGGLLEKIAAMGVETAYVTLHVGLGTFKPVMEENIREGRLHLESFGVEKEQAERIESARRSGRRIIAVGTTATRVLETLMQKCGSICAYEGETDMFIRPPYRFQAVSAMITNFHVPRSSLLMLVSAFADREFIFEAYRQAIEKEYRFFSFGDAMFIQ